MAKTRAEIQAAYRERKGVQIAVTVPADVAEAFRAYCARQMADGPALTQGQVVERLIRATIMRRR